MAMNLDACSGLSLGIFTFLQVVPGKTEVPGVGRRQNAIAPALPVYCSNRMFVGASLIPTFCALAGLASEISAKEAKSIFFMIGSIE